MNWLLENLQVVLIALVVIGSLVKNVLDSRNQREQEFDPGQDDERPHVPIDEDKSYRKGSSGSAPPPLARHGSPPPLPSMAEVAAQEAALQHQRALADRLRQIRENKATTTGGAAATRARVAAAKSAPAPATLVSPSSIRSRLRDQAEVRRAVILREILDPPVGLR